MVYDNRYTSPAFSMSEYFTCKSFILNPILRTFLSLEFQESCLDSGALVVPQAPYLRGCDIFIQNSNHQLLIARLIVTLCRCNQDGRHLGDTTILLRSSYWHEMSQCRVVELMWEIGRWMTNINSTKDLSCLFQHLSLVLQWRNTVSQLAHCIQLQCQLYLVLSAYSAVFLVIPGSLLLWV